MVSAPQIGPTLGVAEQEATMLLPVHQAASELVSNPVDCSHSPTDKLLIRHIAGKIRKPTGRYSTSRRIAKGNRKPAVVTRTASRIRKVGARLGLHSTGIRGFRRETTLMTIPTVSPWRRPWHRSGHRFLNSVSLLTLRLPERSLLRYKQKLSLDPAVS
ncbi:MAG: hypothetical protein KDA85_17985 [Planctomycetaceae bacterium]|nr:hypothetical protein [Planctomycetaceae bacterium]